MILLPDILPFILRDRIIDTSDSEINPLNIVVKNQDTLSVFYMNRSLSIYRENAKYMLNELGISQRNDVETKKKMLLPMTIGLRKILMKNGMM